MITPRAAPTILEHTADATGARKLVLAYADGARVETVLVPRGHGRHSLCISTQAGCRMRCRFCATGAIGFTRHLSADEIVAQVILARDRLGWPVRNVICMGMGEPLDNCDALIPALQTLHAPDGLCFAQDRLCVCTLGVIPGLHRLRALGWSRLELCLSLTTADDTLRRQLMPATAAWPLDAVQTALIAYRPRRNFRLGIHVCLLPDINDGPQQAEAIAAFCAPLGRVLVQVIPYHPGDRALTRAPTTTEVDRFVDRLRTAGVPARRRLSKALSLAGACGQLTAGNSPWPQGHHAS